MKEEQVIVIIGAGICGLFAACELSQKGKRVIILEARETPGGRIRTISPGFSRPVDAGAEFIHGDLPITKALLKEAGVTFHDQEGEFYRSKDSSISQSDDFIEGWDRVMKELKSLQHDTTLAAFLSGHFPSEKDKELRNAVTRLAEGFDAADAERISAFAVREEWSGDTIESSSQIEGGYMALVEFLLAECKKNKCEIRLSTEVKEIRYEKERVTIVCSNGEPIEASQALITVSLGMLTSAENEKGHIHFIPGIPEKIAAAKKMGFGPVIKINLEFQSVFWNNSDFSESATQLPDLGFLNSESEFAVWWTQSPGKPFLTGWCGGSRAEKLSLLSDDALLEKAIASLSAAMLTSEQLIRQELLAGAVSNWGRDPFTKGAYSYETTETAEAKKILSEPIEQTIYFAGEALGNSTGTVEAALESAKEAVKKMI